MGAVFEAVNERIGKRVALKVLDPEVARRGDEAARLVQEAQVAAAVKHPGIVEVYDVETTDDGLPFLVMEPLEGRTLKEMIDERPSIDVATAAFVSCQVLSALSAAHDAGVIHRDLKPSNIFLVETGAALPEVKLLDFGISRLMRQGLMNRQAVTIPVTQTGVVLGTPQFMSPEQARGQRDIDHRTDLFSLGTVLYLALCGEMPFRGENYNALIAAIMTDEPARPRARRPDLSPEMEKVILRALEKDRDRRFQSAAEMFVHLLPFVDAGARDRVPPPVGPLPPVVEAAPPPRPSRRWRTLALGIGLAGLVALVSLSLSLSRVDVSEPTDVAGQGASGPDAGAASPARAPEPPDGGDAAPRPSDGDIADAAPELAEAADAAPPRRRPDRRRRRTATPTKGGIFSDSPYD